MACCNSWKTFSCRSSSRVTSAIAQTVRRGLALAFAERAHAHAQPASGLAAFAVDANLLLQAAALARRLEQAEDRLGDTGIAHEHALDRPDIVGAGGLDQIEIGDIGVDDAAGGVGDQDRVAGAVHQTLDQGTGGIPTRGAQHAGGEREQQEHPDHREHGQQRQDIGLGAWCGRSASARRRRPPARPRSAAQARCCRRAGRCGCGRPPPVCCRPARAMTVRI